MDLVRTAIYGLVRGVCALLPVSADGIFAALDHFAGIGGGQSGDLCAAACIGALLAVTLRYIRYVSNSAKGAAVMLFRMAGPGFSWAADADHRQRDAVRFLLSVLPAAASMLFGRGMTSVCRDSDIIVEGICFLICGSFSAAAFRSAKGDKGDGSMSAGDALLMGAAVLFGMYPGISPFAAAVSVALLMGYSPEYSVRTSAFTSVAAGLFYSLCGAGAADPAAFSSDPISLAVCAAAAAAAAFGTVWLTEWLFRKDRSMIFSYISIALGLVTVILGTAETVSGLTLRELFQL